jgi:N,N'-diacetyllegionaminate synthase
LSSLTIVAEAAQGYEGDLTQAKLLVRAAAAGGADLVKFQLVYADELAVPDYRWYGLFKQLEMPAASWQAVRDETQRSGIRLAFDVFGLRSLEQALDLGASVLKIHSTDFFNEPLIAQALRSAPEVHLSLGGVDAAELDAWLDSYGTPNKLVLMCGYQAEPTQLGDNHLARLATMRARYPRLRLGWMDHADGAADEATWLGVLALPYGVSIIEKHVTLSRALDLEDGVSALGPAEFAQYASRLRRAALAIGSGVLALTDEERAYRRRALKVVVATERVRAGAAFDAGMVALRRAPLDDGREPLFRVEQVVGRSAVREIAPGTPVCEGDLV